MIYRAAGMSYLGETQSISGGQVAHPQEGREDVLLPGIPDS